MGRKIFAAIIIFFLLAALAWNASASSSGPVSPGASLENSFVQPGSIFASALSPFARLAQIRRIERSKADAPWSQRVDPALNADRINFVIYLYGETYEPSPLRSEVTQTGSFTLVSLNLKSSLYNKITISRDFDSPEVARIKTGDPTVMNPSTRIGEAMEVGGFDLSRMVIENATGLSADFQFKVPDTLVVRLIDLLGGVDVEVPADIGLYEFYIDDRAFPARNYVAACWHMDGLTALGYAKAMPKGEYTMDTERVLRSQAVLDAALVRLRQNFNSTEAMMLVPKLMVLTLQGKLSGVETDFDRMKLVESSLNQIARNFVYAFAHYGFDLGFPHPAEGLYAGAEYQGGGGGWRIPPGDMLIPIDGDPREDLVKDYWRSVREFIRSKLMP